MMGDPMLPNEKFKFEVTKTGNRNVVRLRGSIDEDTEFEGLMKLAAPLVFNFKDLIAINSCGIRSWVNLLKDLGNIEIYYEECTPVVVRQMNMVPSFVGNAKVLSVYVPYVCDDCEAEKLVLVPSDKFAGGKVSVQDSFPCETCKKGTLELDGHPQQFFAFAK
jgi:anti-anti-sigma regulatory factor